MNSTVSPSLQNLEEMEILSADNLKQVFYSEEGDDIIVKSKIKDGIIDFPQLRKLFLFSVSSCSFFGPKDFAAQLPSLQVLTIGGHQEGGNLFAQLQVCPLYFSSFFFLSNLNCQLQYIVIICSIFQISKTKVIDKFFNHPLNLIDDLNWLRKLDINYCNVSSY